MDFKVFAVAVTVGADGVARDAPKVTAFEKPDTSESVSGAEAIACILTL